MNIIDLFFVVIMVLQAVLIIIFHTFRVQLCGWQLVVGFLISRLALLANKHCVASKTCCFLQHSPVLLSYHQVSHRHHVGYFAAELHKWITETILPTRTAQFCSRRNVDTLRTCSTQQHHRWYKLYKSFCHVLTIISFSFSCLVHIK